MSGGATFRFLYFPPLVMLAPDWYFCPSRDSIRETMLIPSGASLPPMVTVPPMSMGSGGGSSPLCARTCPPACQHNGQQRSQNDQAKGYGYL